MVIFRAAVEFDRRRVEIEGRPRLVFKISKRIAAPDQRGAVTFREGLAGVGRYVAERHGDTAVAAAVGIGGVRDAVTPPFDDVPLLGALCGISEPGGVPC